MEHHEQGNGRDGDSGEFQAVLEGLHEGDPLHAPACDRRCNHQPQHHHADPARAAEGDLQRDTSALELGEEVEAADQENHHGRGLAQRRRVETALGEIGDGVGPNRRRGAATTARRTRYPAV